MDAAKPQTDRELLLSVVSRLESLGDSMGRIASSLESLEKNRVVDIEDRLFGLEKWQAEQGGAWKFVSACGVILGIVAVVMEVFRHGF